MLNPRKELKRERRVESEEWRVKIFFSGRIPRDTGGLCRRVTPREISAPVSPSDRTAREMERLRRDKNGPASPGHF